MPTKHNSDEANNFNYIRTETYDHDARDATLTLNMFKISKDKNVFVPADQFFSMIPSVHQFTEVENLYAAEKTNTAAVEERKSVNPF